MSTLATLIPLLPGPALAPQETASSELEAVLEAVQARHRLRLRRAAEVGR